MRRINKILSNNMFLEKITEIDKLESDRIYCKHNISHFLDVARIAYIKLLENNIDVSKEIVYAIGLLHDLGRADQYKFGTPHNINSRDIIKDILIESDFDSCEIEIIVNSIEHHNQKDEYNILNSLIYEADKESRICMFCNSKNTCIWKNKNMYLGD